MEVTENRYDPFSHHYEDKKSKKRGCCLHRMTNTSTSIPQHAIVPVVVNGKEMFRLVTEEERQRYANVVKIAKHATELLLYAGTGIGLWKAYEWFGA